MVVPIEWIVTLGVVVFFIGSTGLYVRRQSVIHVLMCLEVMLLGVNINFVGFSQYMGNIQGQIFSLFILTVAAAEAAIGLAIVVLYYRNRGHINVDKMTDLKQ